jgi:hypothetical protein
MVFTPQQERPIYIFDLDDTLALIDHRRRHVEAPIVQVAPCDVKEPSKVVKEEVINGETKWFVKDPTFKPDWKGFYEACHMDQPNMPVIRTFMSFYTLGCDMRIWSGREDSVREKTSLWLQRHLQIPGWMIENMLKMRPAGDYTPDDQLKQKWLNLLPPRERARLIASFEDRKKVVDMWRKNGVTCFQVAEGDF